MVLQMEEQRPSERKNCLVAEIGLKPSPLVAVINLTLIRCQAPAASPAKSCLTCVALPYQQKER